MTALWADQAGPSVKEDVTSLLNPALDVTSASIHGGIASRHFIVLMDLEGELLVRMGFGTSDVGALVEPVLDDYSSLRAILCVRDCGDETDPTLRAFGDHREAPAFDCEVSWRRTESSRLDVVSFDISVSAWWLFD